MIKKILVCCSLLILFGCQQVDVGYERDTREGRIEAITIESYIEKQEEAMVVFISQPYCQSCEIFKEMLEIYLQEHHLVLYEIDMMEEEKKYTKEERTTLLEETFPGFKSTPAIYYVDEKQQLHHLEATQENISEEGFDAWVVSYQLDKKQ